MPRGRRNQRGWRGPASGTAPHHNAARPVSPPLANPRVSVKIPDGCEHLIDHTGNWMPAPVEWDMARKHFTNKPEHVQAWVNKSSMALSNYLTPMPMRNEYETAKGKRMTRIFSGDVEPSSPTIKVMGDIVPRYWIPEDMEDHLNCNTFWEWLKMGPPYATCSYEQVDLECGRTRPWWQTYPSTTAWYLDPPLQMAELGIETSDESAVQTAARKADKGANHASVKYKEKQRARAAQRKRQAEEGLMELYPPDLPAAKPISHQAVNIFTPVKGGAGHVPW